MKRKITEQLVRWKNKKNRMPLILNGARQVGKTFILKEFGRLNYKNFVYINLETNVAAGSYFETDITPSRIIKYLESIAEQRIIPEETLIILDEIQSSERALASLKTFCEEAPEYHIVTAGSLLGVAVNREKFSFPVGKVDELQMFPLDFEEYLWALGKEMLTDAIKTHFLKNEMMPEALHQSCIELYKYYLITGGMPAVVQDYIETQSFISSSEIQNRILNEYVSDMAKYSNSATTIKVRACYNSIPTQLAKENLKFQYKIVQKGGTATLFGEAIEWLNFAGIALKCNKINHGLMPIAAYTDVSDFKLYMSDVGLLTMLSGMARQTILSTIEEQNIFLGAMTENYVAQEFASKKYPLFYWKNDNTAEVDFVLQKEEQIIPVEVKKGKRTKSLSMNMFMKKYDSSFAIRISKKNFGFENQIKSVPLYAVFCV